MKSGYVMGLGQPGDEFCKTDAMLEGIAIGPKVSANNTIGESESGHWLLSSPATLIRDPPLVVLPVDASIGFTPPNLGGTEEGPGTFAVSCAGGYLPVNNSPNCCSNGSTFVCELSNGQECTTDLSTQPRPTTTCNDDPSKGAIGSLGGTVS